MAWDGYQEFKRGNVAMYQVARNFFTAVMAMVVVSCGGDGTFVGTPPTTTPPAADTGIASVTVLSSNSQLATGNEQGVTITAIVKDANNNLIENKNVTFSSDSGALAVIRGTTDAAGTAMATLTTGGNETNRRITVTAASGAITSTILIDVAGTAITISGESSQVLGATTDLILSLNDSFGKALSSIPIAISSTNANTLSAATLTTNSAGQATVSVTGIVAGTDTIVATALGATGAFSLVVSPDSFSFTTPSSNSAEVNLNVAQQVTINWRVSGVPQVGQTISLTATRGTLSAPTAITDASGSATVSISANNAGVSTITASSATGPTAQRNLEFVATTPYSIEVQSALASVAPGGEKTTVTVVVRDINYNLVKNKRILFSLSDSSGGLLSTATAITDSSGQASTVYTSGSATSARDGVRVTALVESTTVTGFVNLTVGARALFIALGTGNTIIEPPDVSDTIYQQPYTVYVTDANGNGVAGADVSLSVLSRVYHKGIYVWNGVYWQVNVDPLRGSIGVRNCISEDFNTNGILDLVLGEDINGDGALTPGNRVAVSALAKTDTSGFAVFNLTYAQQYANWLGVTLEARARVQGTEASAIERFNLAGAASDFDKETKSPPGQPSPFGLSNTCTDTN